MKKTIALSAMLALAPATQAADIEAGKAKVAEVCSACHGANGVSVSDTIPNLAGQRVAYLETQLRAYKDGSRKPQSPGNPAGIMNAMAGQLSPAQIADVAAYYASLPGATGPAAKSAQLPHVSRSSLTFPEGFKDSFVKYHAINFPATKQVRYYYANKPAVEAAKAGRPLPDGSYLIAEVYAAKLDAAGNPVSSSDGLYVPEKPLFYTGMGTGAGWGNEFPDALRNGNWNYAVFTLDKKARPGVNQAECLACHKPLDSVSYTFTIKELSQAK
ncbi:MAG: cytochrome P460 family protein [Betaproteobacteria bacterium]